MDIAILLPSIEQPTIFTFTDCDSPVINFSVVAKSHDGVLPLVVKTCVEYLEVNGIEVEGLFRRSPAVTALKDIQTRFDEGD